MIPEAPFLFSIAGLSASLAGLAGLVAALRRGHGAPGDRCVPAARDRGVIATGSAAAIEGLLVLMLARPMLAFLLVLSSFEVPN